MKTLALFGATGQTGQKFLEAALSQGYAVKALVRDKQKLKQNHPVLHVVEGDILDQDKVDQAVEDTDVVISLFGHVNGSPAFLQRDGTRNVLSAMDKHGVERIISLSGGALPFPEKDKPKFADKLIKTIMKLVAPKVLNDAIAHADVLKRSQKKWVIVRGPRLTNDAKQGRYRVGWVGVNASTKISRADLADFLLTQVEDERFNYQMPFVSV